MRRRNARLCGSEETQEEELIPGRLAGPPMEIWIKSFLKENGNLWESVDGGRVFGGKTHTRVGVMGEGD